MSELHFMDFIQGSDANNIDVLIEELESYHRFDTATRARAWKSYFNDCVVSEWDEGCLSEPIPELPIYEVFEDDSDMQEQGWFHSWELPDGYEPQDTHYDDGGL